MQNQELGFKTSNIITLRSLWNDQTGKMKVLAQIVSHGKNITQSELVQKLGKTPTNISNYYFKPLIEHDIIEIKETVGRHKYWGLTKKYLPLKRVIQSQKNIQKQLISMSSQLELFK